MNKKVILVLSIITIILSLSISFAATFGDVEGKACEDAVDILSSLNIISGYPDNTYKPDDVVKRSEMAKLLVVAIGRDSDATAKKGKTNFSDVAADHWASGYINIAVEEGLIKGYPDGTFAPEDTVSYAEAVTMLLRALGYGNVVDKSGSWPTNYLNRAKELPVLNNTGVTVENAGKGANRGNVSILIWNTLETGVCTITSENASGVVYGQGTKLLKLKHSKYTCTEKATITDISLENKTITYTDVYGTKVTLPYAKSDIKSMYGKQVTMVYDSKAEEYKKIKIASSNKTISGDVTDVTGTKIYIKNKAYAIPSSKNIKLIGIDDIEDAEEAYITTVNGTEKYILAIGTEELYYGIVTNASATVDDNKAVKITDLDGDTETYELAKQNVKVAKGDVLIYTLDSKDRLTIKANKDVKDSMQIDSLEKYSIKFKNKSKTSFSTSDDIIVLYVDFEDYEISKLSAITKIDEDSDSAIVVTVNDCNFVIAFQYGLDKIDTTEDEEDEELTRSEAKSKLTAAIKKANKLDETKYTIASYANVEKYLEIAEDINTSKDSIAKIATAASNLEKAIKKLSDATSTDKKIRTAYATLTSKITAAKKYAKADYTTTTYTALQTAITAGQKLSITSSTITVEKINTAVENIQKAINGLETVESGEQLATAKTKLAETIAKAEKLDKTLYTTASYAKLQAALTAAKAIDLTTSTAGDITKQRGNIETAIEELETTDEANLAKALEDLANKIAESEALTEATYTEGTWESFAEVLEEVKGTSTTGLTVAQIKALTTKLDNSIDELVTKADENRKNILIGQLEALIESAGNAKEETWTGTATWAVFQEKVTQANLAITNKETISYSDMKKVYNELNACWGIE